MWNEFELLWNSKVFFPPMGNGGAKILNLSHRHFGTLVLLIWIKETRFYLYIWFSRLNGSFFPGWTRFSPVAFLAGIQISPSENWAGPLKFPLVAQLDNTCCNWFVSKFSVGHFNFKCFEIYLKFLNKFWTRSVGKYCAIWRVWVHVFLVGLAICTCRVSPSCRRGVNSMSLVHFSTGAEQQLLQPSCWAEEEKTRCKRSSSSSSSARWECSRWDADIHYLVIFSLSLSLCLSVCWISLFSLLARYFVSQNADDCLAVTNVWNFCYLTAPRNCQMIFSPA